MNVHSASFKAGRAAWQVMHDGFPMRHDTKRVDCYFNAQIIAGVGIFSGRPHGPGDESVSLRKRHLSPRRESIPTAAPRRVLPLARAVRPVNLPSSGGSERGASPSPGTGGSSPGGDSPEGEPPQVGALFRCLGRERGLLESIRRNLDALLSRGGCSA
jgi:hypothetical protein